MSRSLSCACFVGVMLLALSAMTDAQTREPVQNARPHLLVGSVKDSAGGPIALAEVRMRSAGGWLRATRTDVEGHFSFAAVPSGKAQLQIRRLGFLPVSRTLDVSPVIHAIPDSTEVVLIATAAELEGIEIKDRASRDDPALRGFYARRETNLFGRYLDRSELVATHAQRTSEALRSIPGIVIQPSSRVGNTVRFRNCRPTVWLDGVRIPDSELDEVTTLQDVAALEIYNSLAGLPQQFIDRTNPCGGILVWSRNR